MPRAGAQALHRVENFKQFFSIGDWADRDGKMTGQLPLILAIIENWPVRALKGLHQVMNFKHLFAVRDYSDRDGIMTDQLPPMVFIIVKCPVRALKLFIELRTSNNSSPSGTGPIVMER